MTEQRKGKSRYSVYGFPKEEVIKSWIKKLNELNQLTFSTWEKDFLNRVTKWSSSGGRLSEE